MLLKEGVEGIAIATFRVRMRDCQDVGESTLDHLRLV